MRLTLFCPHHHGGNGDTMREGYITSATLEAFDGTSAHECDMTTNGMGDFDMGNRLLTFTTVCIRSRKYCNAI
jgi:hypothetical protein